MMIGFGPLFFVPWQKSTENFKKLSHNVIIIQTTGSLSQRLKLLCTNVTFQSSTAQNKGGGQKYKVIWLHCVYLY